MTTTFFKDLLRELELEYTEMDGVYIVTWGERKILHLIVRENPLIAPTPFFQILLRREYPFSIKGEVFFDLLQAITIVNAESDAPCIAIDMGKNEMQVSYRQAFWVAEKGLNKDLFKSILSNFIMLSDVSEPFLHEMAQGKLSIEQFVETLEKAAQAANP